MRSITCILAFLIITFSCIPCADDAAMHTETTSITAHQDDQGQHPDVCSPFCICACCAVISFIHLHPHINFSHPEAVPTYNSFYDGSILDIALPIWQPPQLA